MYNHDQDGPCKICKRFSDTVCDSCGLYFCNYHMKRQNNHDLCEECKKKSKKLAYEVRGNQEILQR